MSAIPENFESIGPQAIDLIAINLPEEKIYAFVTTNKEFFFNNKDNMPHLANKYYNYTINHEIWEIHNKQKLSEIFTSVIFDKNTSENDLQSHFKTQTSLQYLSRLNLSHLSDEEIRQIAENLPDKTNITHLNLDESTISNETLYLLLQKCPNLDILELADCEQIKDIDPNQFPELTHLDALSLQGMKITNIDFAEILSKCPNISELQAAGVLTNMNIDFGHLPILNNLIDIDLSYSEINANSLITFLNQCPNLESLNLKGNKSLNKAIEKDLKPMNQLTHIDLRKAKVSYDFLYLLTSNSPNLTSAKFDRPNN